jgi:hypothetical protein
LLGSMASARSQSAPIVLGPIADIFLPY